LKRNELGGVAHTTCCVGREATRGGWLVLNQNLPGSCHIARTSCCLRQPRQQAVWATRACARGGSQLISLRQRAPGPHRFRLRRTSRRFRRALDNPFPAARRFERRGPLLSGYTKSPACGVLGSCPHKAKSHTKWQAGRCCRSYRRCLPPPSVQLSKPQVILLSIVISPLFSWERPLPSWLATKSPSGLAVGL